VTGQVTTKVVLIQLGGWGICQVGNSPIWHVSRWVAPYGWLWTALNLPTGNIEGVHHPMNSEVQSPVPEVNPPMPECHPPTPEVHPSMSEGQTQILEVHPPVPECYCPMPEGQTPVSGAHPPIPEVHPQVSVRVCPL